MFDHDIPKGVIGIELLVGYEKGIGEGVRRPLDEIVRNAGAHVRKDHLGQQHRRRGEVHVDAVFGARRDEIVDVVKLRLS